MRNFLTLVVTIVLLSSLASPLLAHGESTLEGVYEFLRFESPDGSNTGQKGMLIVKSNYLCHLRVNKEREKMVQDEPDEERARKAAAAFRSANGTCGEFSVEDNKISITWAVTVDPNADGNSSEFTFEEKDGELAISPAGGPQFRFIYKRVK